MFYHGETLPAPQTRDPALEAEIARLRAELGRVTAERDHWRDRANAMLAAAWVAVEVERPTASPGPLAFAETVLAAVEAAYAEPKEPTP